MLTGQAKSKGLLSRGKLWCQIIAGGGILETPTDVRLPFLINFKDPRFVFVRDASVMHQKSRKVKKQHYQDVLRWVDSDFAWTNQ